MHPNPKIHITFSDSLTASQPHPHNKLTQNNPHTQLIKNKEPTKIDNFMDQ